VRAAGIDADSVDGFSAVASSATTSQRKGKLVATNANTGELPNNIIAKAPDANKLDGLDSSAYQRSFTNTVVVSPKGTAAASGTALKDALAGITDASASNPYLLHLEPGIYDLGSAELTMKRFVDIEGSGQNVTTIRSTSTTFAPTVRGRQGDSLRDVRVSNLGPDFAIGLELTASTGGMLLQRVTIDVGPSDQAFGIYAQNVSFSVLDSSVQVEQAATGTFAYGIDVLDGAVAVARSEILVLGSTNAPAALLLRSSQSQCCIAQVWDSVLTPIDEAGRTIQADDGYEVDVATTRMTAGRTAVTGAVMHCVADYDDTFQSAGLAVCP
jgi:hypothetical protein